MTIKVTIEHCNIDSKHDIEVHMVRADPVEDEFEFMEIPPHVLSPGQKYDFFVWATQDLLIKEVV